MTHLHETKESRPRRPLRRDDATPQPPQGLVQVYLPSTVELLPYTSHLFHNKATQPSASDPGPHV